MKQVWSMALVWLQNEMERVSSTINTATVEPFSHRDRTRVLGTATPVGPHLLNQTRPPMATSLSVLTVLK